MKTNGLIRACTRPIMPVLAFLTAYPAFAQVTFFSPGNNLFSHQRDEVTQNWKNYHSNFMPLAWPGNAGSSAAMSSNSKTLNEEENISSGITTETMLDARADNNNNPAITTGKISFRKTSFTYPENSKYEIGIANFSSEQVLLYASLLKEYAGKNGYDTTYVFLGNMGMLCNKKRLFVVNLKTMKIETTGLVSHGRGPGSSMFDKQYSDEEGSRCTSLGRYKITKKYNGSYGTAYRMIGLDSTNKSAYSRNIVLHSMMCIPDVENIMPACMSEGCPSVSSKFFTSISKIIDTRKKPVLLWLFDSNLQEIVIEQERPAYNPYAEYGYGDYTLN